jgi:hypothetical protein
MLVFFVASRLRGASTLLIIPVQLKAVASAMEPPRSCTFSSSRVDSGIKLPRKHEGTKKNTGFFVASRLRGASTLLIIPVQLKAVASAWNRPARVLSAAAG